MSNLMINKLKHIDNSRKDLQSLLETKGVNLSNSSKSLDGLISNVGQLSLHNEVNPDTWEGVQEMPDPGTYWKGDEDWRDLIDIDAIMAADTYEYTGKVFYLIRCSDNLGLDDFETGYTNGAILGFQAYRFSDQEDVITLSTNSAHHFAKNKDIVAPNGERFRWIIGYTNSTTSVNMWQSAYLVPEAVVYWSGTYKGICFEDATDDNCYFYWYNASGVEQETYMNSFLPSGHNATATHCVAPRYFEVKDGVDTQCIIGFADSRGYSRVNYRTRTIIVDGYCRCEFPRGTAMMCDYIRLSKPGYGKRLTLTAHANTAPGTAYIYADISGCKGTVNCNVTNGYIRLAGDSLATIIPDGCLNANILCDNIGTMGNAAWSKNTNFQCGDIRYSINASAFRDFDGYIKIGKVGRSIGNYAFYNCRHISTEIIVERPEGDTATATIGHNAFCGSNVEKIDLTNSGVTTIYGANGDPDNIGGYAMSPSFYGAQKLKILHLPKILTNIPSWALARLTVETVTLPEKLVTIGERAFYGSTNLKSISSIPDTIQSIGIHAFAECRKLVALEISSNSMTSLPESMCSGCISMERVIIPDKISTINSSAFAYCRSLKHFTLPDSVLYLGQAVFQRCDALETLTYANPEIGRMLNINQYCFQGCKSLREIFDLSHLMGHDSKDLFYACFIDCPNLTFTVLPTKPVNAHNDNYRLYFYKNTGAKFLMPADYNYGSTLVLAGANWCERNFLDFIQSLPDRTGLTKLTIDLGNDFKHTDWVYGVYGAGDTPYKIYGSVYSKGYVKETDGVLEYSTTQEDDTWTLVADYIAAKNWTLT